MNVSRKIWSVGDSPLSRHPKLPASHMSTRSELRSAAYLVTPGMSFQMSR
jgi:hypothetical protein